MGEMGAVGETQKNRFKCDIRHHCDERDAPALPRSGSLGRARCLVERAVCRLRLLCAAEHLERHRLAERVHRDDQVGPVLPEALLEKKKV